MLSEDGIAVLNARSIAKHLLTNGHEPDPLGNIINDLCDRLEAKAKELPLETVERVARAIDRDLARQASVQSGVQYVPADECGVAVATMNIVVSELARAAIASMGDGVGTDGGELP